LFLSLLLLLLSLSLLLLLLSLSLLLLLLSLSLLLLLLLLSLLLLLLLLSLLLLLLLLSLLPFSPLPRRAVCVAGEGPGVRRRRASASHPRSRLHEPSATFTASTIALVSSSSTATRVVMV